ncbi:MAG: putative CRISPR-associated protein [Candidatus Cloacimonadales bacterium]|nr:putative CRISPR-associated protein [Candidatus Cloacimonadales bacterium]
MRCILTTTGTSIITNIFKEMINKNDKTELKAGESLTGTFFRLCDNYSIEDYDSPEIFTFIKTLNEKYSKCDLTINRLSAETNSSDKMINENLVSPEEDLVVLLHSDTIGGLIATKLLEVVLREKLKFKKIALQKMDGIKGDDADKFGSGLTKLRLKLLNYTQNEYDQLIFNISGGYKGLIPAMTIFSMSENNTDYMLCYLFESSEKIVRFNFKMGEIDLTCGNDRTTIKDLLP